MSVKDNAKKIERFAFMPVCRTPNAGHGWHMSVAFIQQNLQPEPMMPRGREQMVINFEARLLYDTAVGAANVCEKIKLRIRSGFQRGAHVNNMQARHDCGHFAVCF